MESPLAGTGEHEASLSRISVLAPEQRPNIPRFLTPFLGRMAEVNKILAMLRAPDCRLLTLVGSGGIGKTRLAVEVMTRLHDAGFPAVFVDLQPVQSADLIATAIADALDLRRSGQDDPKEQLIRNLQEKQMLLVLDNMEHLLDGAALISELLWSLPDVKLLVTSRIVLHLQEEWQAPVDGLDYPGKAEPFARDADAVEQYDAIRLFVSSAGRVRPDFHLAPELDDVVNLCRLVEGMPLAIELAAAWTKTLPVQEIVNEIQQDLNFLTTPLRNVQEKHRSVLVVFRRTWQLLSAAEREIYKKLSVFRGGFDRTAAIEVAGASLPALAALVDKSLLRWRQNGRYEIHELLRQYAEEQLAQSAEDLACARNLHSSYFIGFLRRQASALTTQQREALVRTQAELDNLRVAWNWAIQQKRVRDIYSGAMPLFAFCQGQSRYLEGTEAMANAYDVLMQLSPSREQQSAVGAVLTGWGWLAMRLGRIEEAGKALETARDLYEHNNLSPEPLMGADPLAALPVLATTRGDYAAAAMLSEEAWRTAAARNDQANLTLAGYGRTSAALAQGRYDDALRHARETLSLARDVGNRWFTAYVYNQLGQITQALGDIPAAKEYYAASFAIREEFDDPEGMAVALNHLGQLALLKAEFAQAQELYQQSLAIYQTIGDQGGLVQAWHGLGMAAHQLHHHDTARDCLRCALQTAVDAQLTPLLLLVLVGVGRHFVETPARGWGVAALQAVQEHPATTQRTKEEIQEILALHHEEGSPADTADRPPADRPVALASLVNDLIVELSTQITHTVPEMGDDKPQPPTGQVSAGHSLIEPLSEREVEVLALIASGLKNREIADRLSVTLSTVKAHSNSIYRKLDVTNRVQAIARGQEIGLL